MINEEVQYEKPLYIDVRQRTGILRPEIFIHKIALRDNTAGQVKTHIKNEVTNLYIPLIQGLTQTDHSLH